MRKSLIKNKLFGNSLQLSLICCQKEVLSVLVWIPCVWEASHPSCSGTNPHGDQPRVASLFALSSVAWAAHFYSPYKALFWDCLLWEDAQTSCFRIGMNLYHIQMLSPASECCYFFPKSTGLFSCPWGHLWCVSCFPPCIKWCRWSGPFFLLPAVRRTAY